MGIERNLDSFGLSHAVAKVKGNDEQLTLIFKRSADGSPIEPFEFGVLDEVEHEYSTASNNPHGFHAANFFWKFFKQSQRR